LLVKWRNRGRVKMLLLLVNVACAHAQVTASPTPRSRPSSNPVGLPGLKYSCRVLPLDGSPLDGAVGFQFADGTVPVDDRLISAVFDSVGNPLILAITATESEGTAPGTVREVSVSFPTDEPAIGFQFLEPAAENTQTETTKKPLSRQMLADSRELAVWLWKHRCGQHTE